MLKRKERILNPFTRKMPVLPTYRQRVYSGLEDNRSNKQQQQKGWTESQGKGQWRIQIESNGVKKLAIH